MLAKAFCLDCAAMLGAVPSEMVLVQAIPATSTL